MADSEEDNSPQGRVTGRPLLDKVIRELNKSRIIIEETIFEDARPIPTGSRILNSKLRIGGIPMGRIVEFFGAPGVGKTSFSLEVARCYLDKVRPKYEEHNNRAILFLDLERTMTHSFINGFGIKNEDIIIVRPKDAAEGLNIAKQLMATGEIGMVILDSVGAIVKEAQMQKEIGANDVGGSSKLMHDACRTLVPVCSSTDTLFVFINQETYKPAVMGADPRTTPGGEALRFFSSLRIRFLKGKPSDKIPNTVGMRAQIVKTKIGPPYTKEVEFAFGYGRGIDEIAEIINVAKEVSMLRLAAKKVRYRMEFGGDETIIDPTDIPAISVFYKHLVEDVQFRESFATAVITAYEAGLGNDEEDEEEDDE